MLYKIISMLSSYVTPLGCTLVAIVGGKTAALGEVATIPGIKTQDGFGITTEAYAAHLSRIGVKQMIEELENLSHAWIIASCTNSDKSKDNELTNISEKILKLSSRIENTILNSSIDGAIFNNIFNLFDSINQNNDGVGFAIRSSGTAEDNKDLSFAGRYKTVLNVRSKKSLENAMLQCWASFFGDIAVMYRNEALAKITLNNTKPEDLTEAKLNDYLQNNISLSHIHEKMGLTALVMVDAKASGVGFNVDVTTGKSAVQISSTWGLGETVVDGSDISPDCFWLNTDNGKLLGWQLGNKPIKKILNKEGGLEITETSPMEKTHYSLSPKNLSELHRAIKLISAEFLKRGLITKFIDIEFAINQKDELIILQARPETIWSNGGKQVKIVDPKAAKSVPNIKFQDAMTGSRGAAVGKLHWVNNPNEVEVNDIIVTKATQPQWATVYSKVKGIVTMEGGLFAHAAVVCRELGIPVIVNATNAHEALANLFGKKTTIDANELRIFADEVPLITGEQRKPVKTKVKSLEEIKEESIKQIRNFRRIELGQSVRIHKDKNETEWEKRPHYPLKRITANMLLQAYELVSATYCPDAPFKAQMIETNDQTNPGNIVMVELEKEFNPMVALLKWTAADLNAFLAKRESLANQLLIHVQSFPKKYNNKIIQNWLKDLHTLYVKFNSVKALSWNIYFLAEHLLAKSLDSIPSEINEKVRSYLPELLAIIENDLPESESAEQNKGYYELLSIVQSTPQLMERLLESDNIGLEEIQKEWPDFYSKLNDYSRQFRHHTKNTAEIENSAPTSAILNDINTGIKRHMPLFDHAQSSFETLWNELGFNLHTDENLKNSLKEALRLSAWAGRIKENEPHHKARVHFMLRDILIDIIAPIIINNGTINAPEDIFNNTIEELITALNN